MQALIDPRTRTFGCISTMADQQDKQTSSENISQMTEKLSVLDRSKLEDDLVQLCLGDVDFENSDDVSASVEKLASLMMSKVSTTMRVSRVFFFRVENPPVTLTCMKRGSTGTTGECAEGTEDYGAPRANR